MMKNTESRSERGRVKKPGLKVTSHLKAAGVDPINRNRRLLAVRSSVKAGGLQPQHNRISRALAAVLKRYADPIRRAVGR